MFALTIFAIITLMIYLRSKFANENEDVLTMSVYVIGISTAIMFLLLFFYNGKLETDYIYLGFIPLFLFGIYYIKEKTKSKKLDIIANQQRYFTEVRAKDIYKFYKTRKSIKSNRVETLINKYSKKLIRNGVIVPGFFLDLKNLKLTYIDSVKDLESSIVFSAVFSKIQEFSKAREVRIDYEKELKLNGGCAEFFLIDLYERLTSPFNISVANLEVIAKNKQEVELLGALDLVNLNSVKRKGAVLYYKYIEFKGRIGDFVKQESNVNPAEVEFDEEYARSKG